jgi:hypothetical protein
VATDQPAPPAPVFDPHAFEQMALRGISASDVAEVLANPVYRRHSYGGKDALYGLTPSGRTLMVVVVAGSAPPIVITVMPFSSRRLRRLMDREDHS